MRSSRSLVVLGLAIAAAAYSVAVGAPQESSGWVEVCHGKLFGIGGLALERRNSGRTDFIVVHDNKKADQPRIGRVSVAAGTATYAALAWPAGAEWPVDLESISAVPDHPGRFATLASAGRLFIVDVDGDKVSLVGSPVDLPKSKALDKPNYEGFALQKLEGRLVAVWADRGDKDAAAKLFWGVFDPVKGPEIAGTVDVRVPWPEADRTRDISDLKVDGAGVVWATAAWDDDNDDSTYRSAAYVVGVLLEPGALKDFRLVPSPVKFRTFPDHKAEALELVPGADGAIVFGTDDENHGGCVLYQ